MHREILKTLDGKPHKDCVEHLGENFYVQHNKYALQLYGAKNNPATIIYAKNPGELCIMP